MSARYSQNDEQDVILEYFNGSIGRFLDVGAFDGITLSNTRALSELGWTGLLVEPNPYNLCKAIESVRCFEGRVECIACAVSDRDGITNLKMTTEQFRMWASTISTDIPSDYIHSKECVNALVPMVRMDLLSKYGPFDFISIDAEYMDFLILKDSVGKLDGCRLLCVEPRGPEERAEIIDFLKSSLGFTVHYETNENVIAKRL
jgi:FkbM family methyltransferase